ncbi:hypothetical protein D3C79_1072240 [compost metagenome]
MQRGGHVDAGVVVVGTFETDVFGIGVGADALEEIAEAYAAPTPDRAPAFDANVPGDLLGLGHGP